MRPPRRLPRRPAVAPYAINAVASYTAAPSDRGPSALEMAFSPAGQDYAFFDFEDLTSTFQGTDTSTPATANGESVGRWESRGVGVFNGLQATAGFKPKRQAEGITGDVTDDGLLSDWLAAAGNNCILAKFKVPEVVPGTQIVAGSYSGSSRFWIGYDGTSIRRGVGASSASAPSGDVKGQTIVVGLITTGVNGNYRVFLNTADIQSGAHTEGVSFVNPFALCCANNGGVLANFSGAGLQKVAFGLVAPTATELAAIAAEWA